MSVTTLVYINYYILEKKNMLLILMLYIFGLACKTEAIGKSFADKLWINGSGNLSLMTFCNLFPTPCLLLDLTMKCCKISGS